MAAVVFNLDQKRGTPARPVLCLLLSLLVSTALAKNLYPECGGAELTGTASAGHTSTIMTLPTSGTTLTLSCFAHEVESSKGGQKDKSVDYCRVSHQTEYAYQLVIRATYQDNKGDIHERDFNVRDIAGGSIDSVTIRTDYPSRFSLRLVNLAESTSCTLSLRALMTYTITGSAGGNATGASAPSIAAVVPRTIYVGHEPTSIVLQYPDDDTDRNTKQDTLFLCPVKDTCGSASTTLGMDAAKPPVDFQPLNIGLLYTTRARTFSKPGSYRVCYRSGQGSDPVSIALVTVFDSNPAYFDVISGQGPFGEVYAGVPIVIKFFGTNLDTRPSGDSAKMVVDGEDCNTGRAAGGVSVATDLGPADNYGPNTTFSLWEVTIHEGGAYKMCYKRAGMSMFSSVPFITTVDPGNGAATETTGAPVPVPKDGSGNTCPLAPAPHDGGSWVKYQSVKLVMVKPKSAQEVVKTIGDLFCVPRSAFAITRITRNQANEQMVVFSFLCDNVTRSDGGAACSSTERANYAASLGSSNSDLLKQYEIKLVSASTSITTMGDDPREVISRGAGALSTLIVCMTVVSLAALVAFTIVKYREKRQYMVQFGMDDADLDDMYTAGAVSPAPMGGAMSSEAAAMTARYELTPVGPAAGGGKPRGGPVRDAVIEIED